MMFCLSYKKYVPLCTLIALGALISSVKCLRSCSGANDCGYSEKCCRQTSVGICRPSREACLGDSCFSNSECPSNAVCCNIISRCVEGNSCIGHSCVLESDCGYDETCCDDVCASEKDCRVKTRNRIIIGVTAACVVVVIAIALICGYHFYNRRRRQRLMAFSNVPFGHLTESTTTHLPQLANSTLQPVQQPPLECTASVTPPQYTNESGRMNVTQKASVPSPHHQ